MEIFAIVMDTIYFVIRVAVSFIIVKVLTEAVLFMSEIMKSVSDVASSPKTQGLVGLVTGGVWTYDAVMDAASDLLILVSLISGFMAVIGYIAAESRKKKRYSREKQESEERMDMERKEYEARMEVLRKEANEKDSNAKLNEAILERIAKKHPSEAEEVAMDLINSHKIIRMNSKDK